MARSELKTTSFDPSQLKNSLIEFLQETDQFGEFNFEGSAINTMVDLLVRDTTYNAYLANMLSNESFLESAQLRSSVVSHAQKLSYIPKSRTASRLVADVTITPSSEPTNNIIYGNTNTQFLSTVDNQTYTFTLTEPVAFSYSREREAFFANDVEMYQGQYIVNRFVYAGQPIEIPNRNIDTSTLKVYVDDDVLLKYQEADSITRLGSQQNVYFVRENNNQRYEIKFGANILGAEPSEGSVVRIEYINTEDQHANGLKSLIAGTGIGGYSNISTDVTTESYGGSDRDDIETMRFLAPKFYQTQDRALAVDDYRLMVLDRFSFITSVNVWGGEDHKPPRYGNVMISVIPEDGLVVTDFLKRRIEETLKEKAVGSVTPIVIDPDLFDIDLTVSFSFDRQLTRKTRPELDADIRQVINQYNDQQLNKFKKYYNQSELVSLLKQNQAIESVVVDEQLSIEVETEQFVETHYDVDFRNEVKPSSFYVSDFTINNNASEEKIEDNGEGTIVYSRREDNETKTDSIGSVDYSSGEVSIFTAYTQSGNPVYHCTPSRENIYVKQNSALKIGDVETKEMVLN